ncbi:MAG: hypothetical protein JXR25_05400 [Pontiellaceae bacterium]|nr:hypothetical protein [Pontiellaceae bacterium]MBN2784241.1 hypothetical protein [Pontiellaceae bacterium]
MKKSSERIGTGAPSGLVVSLIFHGAVIVLAGLWIVGEVLHENKDGFVAPDPVVRPPMKLIRPRVSVRPTSKPRSLSRITVQFKRDNMPQFALCNSFGNGTDLLEGTGFEEVMITAPEFKALPNPFGDPRSTGNDLEGRFYDFKRNARGLTRAITGDPDTVPNDVDNIIHNFMKRGWSEESFRNYYCAPRRLFSSCVCIGTVQSTLAPEAFGETQTDGYAWAVVYRGQLVYPEDITFRFRGVGDKFMGVRVDGKVVLLAVYNSSVRQFFSDIWSPSAPEHRIYPMAEGKQAVGDWITLKGGQPVDIEILLGDRHGGLVYHQLVVEVEGEEYPRNPFGGGPTLPVFKTDHLSRAQIDALCLDVYPGDVNLTNGPVFCDVFPSSIELPDHPGAQREPVMLSDDIRAMRPWTLASGSTIPGRLLLQAEDYALLEAPDGRQRKVPLSHLSSDDQQFLALSDPPQFRIDFVKHSDQVLPSTLSPYDNGRPLSILDYIFGARIKWSSGGTYNAPLKVDCFAIGREVNGDHYILLDRMEEWFVPLEEASGKFTFSGETVRLKKYANRFGCPMRGREEDGYLIVVSDQQGRIVQYKASNEFLFEHLSDLDRLPVNAHFDGACVRRYPSRPVDADRADWVLMAGAD